MFLKIPILYLFLQIIGYPYVNENLELSSDTIQRISNTDKEKIKDLRIIYDKNSSSISLSSSKNLLIKSFSIYDLRGRNVLKRRRLLVRKERKVSANKLNKGIYVLKIELNDNSLYTKKIFIDK